ncbi:ankyrin repeat ph and sec7 domain containing protein secg-related [Anaeramoeba ignava]|uniref:Ankyrin repeat ph and sec7 domain containing protein secg-related n=1 Tax=Anaeramoeba ignava TaxID=1746090 RepID=A0A9Q0RBX4_ANAIG|nr:ankyrin repeat ph and sec7 domain containing protein secg-related [Anaeramoeba ignava]
MRKILKANNVENLVIESSKIKPNTIIKAIQENCSIPIFQTLLDHGNKLDYKTYGESIIEFACKHKLDIEKIRFLIKQGAPVNTQNKDTPLHFACFYPGNFPLIDLLLNETIDINSKGGNTPLHNCAYFECGIDKFIYLISKGADPNIMNGQKPIDLVQKKESFEFFFKCESLFNDFRILFEKQEVIDIKFELNDGEIGAHKTILAAKIGEENIEKFKNSLKTKVLKFAKKILYLIYFGISLEEDIPQLKLFFEQTKFLKFENFFGFEKFFELMDQLYQSEKTKNFTILVGSNEIKVHRVVLSARSELYKGMFMNVNDDSNKVNDYSGNSFKSFEQLIHFFYLNQIDPKCPKKVIQELTDSVEYYQVRKLKEQIEFQFKK